MDQAIKKALHNNPQLKQEKLNVNQAYHAYKNAVEVHQPKWSLSGERITRHSDQDDTQLGITMNWPLSNGDNLRAEVESGGRSRISYKHSFLKNNGFSFNKISRMNQLDQWNSQQDQFDVAKAQTIVNAEISNKQTAWDNNNVEGETTEEKNDRLGRRPDDITLVE